MKKMTKISLEKKNKNKTKKNTSSWKLERHIDEGIRSNVIEFEGKDVIVFNQYWIKSHKKEYMREHLISL